MFKFIPNRIALIVLISACIIILISMGLRQTFGLFFKAFEEGLGCTSTESWISNRNSNAFLGHIRSYIWFFSR